ncbi:tetratricopeptide repeat protein [Morganella sp. EGD-HP17]|uniref:tetratricopeptide repeat protein n=1 Tax=Morganella sp. EGD-HP17 TaxID=1435146 RepID=UPI0004214867|nr:sel1 repeat family protein [Morganella sp. EGD-HP17]ETO41158.1 hypothetical protein X965_13120 [Morganella sp. EGD-HP17]
MEKCILHSLFSAVILSVCLSAPAGAVTPEEMAQQGDTDAMIILSYIYLSEDTAAGTEKAKYWLGKAVEQGDTDAQGILGTVYYTEKNYEAAAPLLTRACHHNNQSACKLLHKLQAQ